MDCALCGKKLGDRFYEVGVDDAITSEHMVLRCCDDCAHSLAHKKHGPRYSIFFRRERDLEISFVPLRAIEKAQVNGLL